MQRPKTKWLWELLSPDLMLCSSLEEIRYSGQTPYQSVEIARTGSFGWCLILDGKVQSSENDEFVYHEALVHLPMITHPNPRRIFIAGGAEGGVAREVLSHKAVESVVMVDIDQQVVDICRDYLPDFSRGAFEDPRLRLQIYDAAKYLKETQDQYDVMILDLPDPIEDGPAYLLYTQNFYRMVSKRLTPEGLVVVQAGSSFIPLHTEAFTAIHNTMESIFPAVYPYCTSVPAFGGSWGYVMASNGPDPWGLDHAEIDIRIKERVNGQLHLYDGISHEGLLRIPKYLREALENEERLITEDDPIFVY